MSDHVETVPMDDKELFASIMTDEAPDEQPETSAEPETQPRDESGRFAPKAAEPEKPAEVTAEKPVETKDDDGAQVPSWRLRELREQREAAETRARDFEQRFATTQYQLQQMQRQLQESQQPKTPPDMFENPQGFMDHNVRQALNPVQSEVQQMREFFSRKDAVREHGQETVQQAYDAIAAGLRSGDREAASKYQEAMSSMDPYGVITSWHKQRSVLSKIGNDPDAWFEKTLQERLKDPAYQAKVLENVRGTAPTSDAQGRPVIKLPPSLNRATGANVSNASDDDNDDSDKALFAYATRR